MLLELIILSYLNMIQPAKKQYYQFTKPGSFGVNAIFEKNGDNFKPIVGNWNEDNFKKLTGGQGFDRVTKLNTSIDEILKSNPTYKQNGVIMPEHSNYEIYGKIKSKDYDIISDVLTKFKPDKKIKFNFKNQFKTNLVGNPVILNSETDPIYKAYRDKEAAMTGGATGIYDKYYEITINPEIPDFIKSHTIAHEVGHILFNNKKIPDNLFNENKTSEAGGGPWHPSRLISKQETAADHFADYINLPMYYKNQYPNEYKWFNNLIK